MKNTYRSIGILLAIFILPGMAAACLCAFPPPVDVQLEGHQTVGVFKVVSSETRTEPQKGVQAPKITYVVKLSAEKVFKGSLKQGQEVTLTKFGITGCDRVSFIGQEGRAYLLYVRGDPATDKDWGITACSRSEEVERAAADLMWLEKMESVRGQTRLSGTVRQYYTPANGVETSRSENLADSPVTITGNGRTIELKTDKNGVYEVYDLAPGKYSIIFMRPGGESAGPEDVEVRAAAHSEKNHLFRVEKR